MNEFEHVGNDYCKFAFRYRKRTRLWTNTTTWKPRPLCNKDCGNIRKLKSVETAQRLQSGQKAEWGENYVKL